MSRKINNDDVRNAIEIVVRQKFKENYQEKLKLISDGRIQEMLEAVINSREELVSRIISKMGQQGKSIFITGRGSSTFAINYQQ